MSLELMDDDRPQPIQPELQHFLEAVPQPDVKLTKEFEAFLPHTLSVEHRAEAIRLGIVLMQGDALQGNLFVQMGKHLHQLQQLLASHRTAEGKSAWLAYCETQGYTTNYITRIIQVGKIFTDTRLNIATLSMRHLREIARIYQSEESVEELINFINRNKLSMEHTRLLVSRVKRGDIKLEDIKGDQDFPEEWRASIDEELQVSRDRNARLDKHNEVLSNKLRESQDKVDTLIKKSQNQEAKTVAEEISDFLSSLGSPTEFASKIRALSNKSMQGHVERLVSEVSNWADEVQDRIASETGDSPNWED